MRIFPLYDEPPRSPVECVTAREHDSACKRCKLHSGAVLNRCMEPGLLDPKDGERPLLLVGDFPTQDEDRAGVPFANRAGQNVVAIVRKYWSGPIVLDSAIRCPPGRTKVTEKEVEACLPYTRRTYDAVKPAKVLCFGAHAIRAFTGGNVQPLSVRRGYYVMADGTIVHTMASGWAVSGNRFLTQYLENDVARALGDGMRVRPPPVDASYFEIESAEDAEAACSWLRDGEWVAFDTETAGLMWSDFFEVSCLAIGRKGSDRTYVWSREALDAEATRAPLVALLEDPAVGKGGQNLKYDIEAVKADPRLRCSMRGVEFDTMIHRRQIESDAKSDLAHQQYLVGMGGAKQVPEAALKKIQKAITNARSNGTGQTMLAGLVEPAMLAAIRNPEVSWRSFGYGLLPRDVMHRYCAMDVASTIRLGELYEPVVAATPYVRHAWRSIYRDATHAFARVEEWGMAIDAGRVRELSDYLGFKLADVERRMFAWGKYDPNSPPSVGAFLYGALGLPVLEETNGGAASTAAAVLRQLQDKHPAVALLLEYREIATLKNRYGDGMLAHIRNGRVHPSFWLMGGRAGRMSSSDPNLQNIPSRNKDYASMIKDCFVVPRGRVLIAGDYSQLEYRVAAYLTGDPAFAQVFKDGHDLHRRTAELCAPLLHGKTVAEAEAMSGDEIAQWRRDAKTVNFGTFYGMTVRTLAKNLHCTVARAEQVVGAIYGQFERVPLWMDERKRYAREHGCVWVTWQGEQFIRRQLYAIASRDDKVASRAENGSINTPVQGEAALFALAAIAKLVAWIEENDLDVQVVNTVHDSIMVEAPESMRTIVLDKMREAMTAETIGDVPLVVDFEYGRSWGSMVKAAQSDKVLA